MREKACSSVQDSCFTINFLENPNINGQVALKPSNASSYLSSAETSDCSSWSSVGESLEPASKKAGRTRSLSFVLFNCVAWSRAVYRDIYGSGVVKRVTSEGMLDL